MIVLPCPVGQHVEKVTYRAHIFHFCLDNGPGKPLLINWPMALATVVGVSLVVTGIVYFVVILIGACLYKKAEGRL